MRVIKPKSCPVDEIQREGNPDRGVRQPGPPFGSLGRFTLPESSLLRLPSLTQFELYVFPRLQTGSGRFLELGNLWGASPSG
jgi:hypothetical protein